MSKRYPDQVGKENKASMAYVGWQPRDYHHNVDKALSTLPFGRAYREFEALGANPQRFGAPPGDRGFETIRRITKDGKVYRNSL